MPNNAIGYSFAPTFENAEIARGQQGSFASSPQEALQVLSYRLPRVRGAQGISPLLADEFSGMANMSVLESVFRTILGPDATAQIFGPSRSTGGTSNGGTRPPIDNGMPPPGNLFPGPRTPRDPWLPPRPGQRGEFEDVGRTPPPRVIASRNPFEDPISG